MKFKLINLFIIIIAYSVTSFSNSKTQTSCLSFYQNIFNLNKKILIDSKAIKIVKNKETQKLLGKVLIRSEDNDINIPEAVELWKQLSTFEVFSKVIDSSLVLIKIVPSEEGSSSNTVNFDAEKNLFSLTLSSRQIEKLKNKQISFSLEPKSIIFDPSLTLKKKIDRSVFVSGLVSMSAEPPEAFFAASTKSEMSEMGFNNMPSNTAKTWIVRTADSRAESVFKFYYASQDRPKEAPYADKFLVAVGLGPKNDPTSKGLKEADLIISGDEQKGLLTSILSQLQLSKVAIDELENYSGTAIKTNPKEIFLNSLNLSWYLTKSGFSELSTDPNIFRKIISTEYDEFLSTLFKDGKKGRNKISYLLATSRGCTQGCAICCSGGLSPFQYFSADRIISELQKIKELHKEESQIDIFFVDSNFNNNPERIIELATKIEEFGFYKKFRFFVRHNTLNGFLNSTKESNKTPNIQLIEAYKKLGIKEIMMGVDSYDNASIITLKSNRLLLQQKGIKLRPTYTYNQIAATISEMNKRKIYTRGFLLSNNPFVSDLNRIDSYYNLFLIWAQNPLFSIDARTRNIIQLKPFDGSPVGGAAKQFPHLVKEGRFHTESLLGELDEKMNFLVFNQPADISGIDSGVKALLEQRNYIINKATSLLQKDSTQNQFALAILNKIKQRDFELLTFLKSFSHSYQVEISLIEKEIQAIPAFPGNLSEYQEFLFQKHAELLITSLSKGN